MSPIVPAIIPESFEHLQEAVNTVFPFTHEVQIDIVDGRFVPHISWPYIGKGALQRLRDITESVTVEVDLMIEEPEDVVELYLDLGVSSIVIHLESTYALERICTLKRTHDFKLGLSILNSTPLSELLAHIEVIDYVQLMGIPEIGAQGKPFDERVLQSVQTLRGMYPQLTISIDGSVNKETLPRLYEAGANRFVAGSAIFKASDPHAAYDTLTQLV